MTDRPNLPDLCANEECRHPFSMHPFSMHPGELKQCLGAVEAPGMSAAYGGYNRMRPLIGLYRADDRTVGWSKRERCPCRVFQPPVAEATTTPWMSSWAELRAEAPPKFAQLMDLVMDELVQIRQREAQRGPELFIAALDGLEKQLGEIAAIARTIVGDFRPEITCMRCYAGFQTVMAFNEHRRSTPCGDPERARSKDANI